MPTPESFSILLDASAHKELYAKAFLTAMGALFMFAYIYHVSQPGFRDNGAFWARGTRNPFRNMLFRQDGTLRKHTRAGLIVWMIVWIVSLWFYS